MNDSTVLRKTRKSPFSGRRGRGQSGTPRGRLLDALFPIIRQRVLTTTLTQPAKWWSLSGLARMLHTAPSSLQRELPTLAKVGILERRTQGQRTYFRACLASPFYSSLRALFDHVHFVNHDNGGTQNLMPASPQPITRSLLLRYNRDRLYDEVWRKPVRDVVKNYGVSDVAIAKTCRKLCIPLPGRGYWAKKKAGKPVPERPTLPLAGVS